MQPSLAPGISHRLELVVGREHTPRHLLPTVVLATPKMVELMEQTCLEAVAPHLDDNETTVGVHVNVSHQAAAREGERVLFTCRLLEIDGRRLHFEVRATVGERVIGAGTHDRYVVDRSRFAG